MSVVCRCVSCAPASRVHIWFVPVLVKCDYEFILVQLCLSIIYDYPVYLWSCVFDLVWSTRYSCLCQPGLAWIH